MITGLADTRAKVGLVFDDGFAASDLKVAELFEARGLRATFAVLANPADFMPSLPKGDFALWNDLQARGHVIHPHGYDHSDLTRISYAEAVGTIDACLDHFSQELSGFVAERCIYHSTYNRTTPEIDRYLLTMVGAVRSTGRQGLVGHGMNRRGEVEQRVLSCSWYGPEHCDEHLQNALRDAEVQKPELFLYMLHGLENEGWGPIHVDALERALDFVLASPHLAYTDLRQL